MRTLSVTPAASSTPGSAIPAKKGHPKAIPRLPDRFAAALPTKPRRNTPDNILQPPTSAPASACEEWKRLHRAAGGSGNNISAEETAQRG